MTRKSSIAVRLGRIAGFCGFSLLSGCFSSGYFKNDFSAYSREVGESSNRQLLLNLARLSRDEPPYFIQIGQINQQHTTGGSLGDSTTNGSLTHPSGVAARIVQQTLTLGGTAGATMSEQPSFQFVPLQGDTLSQAITTPIPDKLFLTLYDQGIPADELARTLIQSIQVSPKGVKGSKIFVNDPRNGTYPYFLMICAKFKDCQDGNFLIVDKTGGKVKKTHFKSANITDMATAKGAGLTVANNGNDGYDVTDPSTNYQLAPAPDAAESNDFVKLIASFASGKNDPSKSGIKVTMRTFMHAMSAVSKEEKYFKYIQDGDYYLLDSQVTVDKKHSPDSPVSIKIGNDSQPVTPILKLQQSRIHLSKEYQELLHLDYKGETYSIGDNHPEQSAEGHSDRRVFTLLSYLFTEIAVDPKKLPVQQFIQVQ